MQSSVINRSDIEVNGAALKMKRLSRNDDQQNWTRIQRIWLARPLHLVTNALRLLFILVELALCEIAVFSAIYLRIAGHRTDAGDELGYQQA